MHLNPVRAKLVKPEQALRGYEWSSWREYLQTARKRPAWLRVERVLGEMGIPKDSAAGRRELEREMEGRRSGGDGTAYQPIRRGWFYGDKKLKRELLGQMSERLGPEHYGEERRESQGEKAEQIVGKGLQRLKWTEGTLRERNKGDAEKVKIAVQLRKETLVTVAWIAERLQMGSVANVNTLLYRWRQGKHSK